MTEFGRLDGAANLAGIRGWTGEKAITEVTDQDWAATLGVQYDGGVLLFEGRVEGDE